MTRYIDLNADLGEGFGPWPMGADAAMLDLVTSANIACGGHAGDPDTMVATLAMAKARGVVVGAHPGYADLAGFGRRVIPMTDASITAMVAVQIGGLMAAAAAVGVPVAYVKPHGALANLAADEPAVAAAIACAIRAVSRDLAVLAISGTVLEGEAARLGLRVYSEVFADRAYLPNGRLVPRSQAGAMIADPAIAADRLVGFLESGLMPTLGGPALPLKAHSICVHGDSAGAVAMARHVRAALTDAGLTLAPFIAP